MSEYHAAVGLASMDRYAADVARFCAVAQAYRAHLSAAGNVVFQPGFGVDWCGSVITVRFVGADQERIAARLAAQEIDSRAWWGRGVQRHSAFAGLSHFPLPVTDLLAQETLGLPFYVDMAEQDVERVCRAISHRDRAVAPVGRAA